MKRCPTCNRTYTEEEIIYCLTDGSLLATPSQSEITQRLPPARTTNSSPTEVLSSNPSPTQHRRQGRNPLLVYAAIGLLALLVGGTIGVWVRSSSNNASANKSEVSGNASRANEQNESLQEERASLERERRKLAEERKKLETKTSESISQPIGQAPQSSGDANWFVILGSFPRDEYEKANERLQSVQSLGYDASIIDTDNYTGLKGGLWAVVMGPFSKSKAGSLAAQMKSVRSDVYIRRGR